MLKIYWKTSYIESERESLAFAAFPIRTIN